MRLQRIRCQHHSDPWMHTASSNKLLQVSFRLCHYPPVITNPPRGYPNLSVLPNLTIDAHCIALLISIFSWYRNQLRKLVTISITIVTSLFLIQPGCTADIMKRFAILQGMCQITCERTARRQHMQYFPLNVILSQTITQGHFNSFLQNK